MNARIVRAIVTLMLVPLIGCRTYSAKEAFELSAPWDDYQRVVVRSPKGSVALRTADVPEIRISGTKHASAFTTAEAEERLKHVRIIAEPDTSKGSVFVVKVSYPWWLGSRSVGGNFEIQVPAPCAAQIRTRDGTIAVRGLKDEAILTTSHRDITIEGIAGRVRARTGNGTIVAENVTGDLNAVTNNGEIVAENVTGDLTAKTSNGRIRAKDIRGRCKLQTSIGTIEAENVHGGVEARVSIGGIRADVTPPEDANIELRTGHGSIDLTVPAGLKADLDLSTNNGVVQTVLPDASTRVQLRSQNRMKATINGGGSRIVARTSSGLVTLKSR